jgi:hypothetical protein
LCKLLKDFFCTMWAKVFNFILPIRKVGSHNNNYAIILKDTQQTGACYACIY